MSGLALELGLSARAPRSRGIELLWQRRGRSPKSARHTYTTPTGDNNIDQKSNMEYEERLQGECNWNEGRNRKVTSRIQNEIRGHPFEHKTLQSCYINYRITDRAGVIGEGAAFVERGWHKGSGSAGPGGHGWLRRQAWLVAWVKRRCSCGRSTSSHSCSCGCRHGSRRAGIRWG